MGEDGGRGMECVGGSGLWMRFGLLFCLIPIPIYIDIASAMRVIAYIYS